MRRTLGFTLIELMVTVVVIAILTAIAYPSYQDYIRRGIRSQGQQFLLDVVQREEQYFLDQRAYTLTLGAGGLGMSVPVDVAAKYQPPVFTAIAGPPAGYRIALTPAAGTIMANDGTLYIDNTQLRWRTLNAPSTAPGANDCRWEDTRCKPS